MNRWAVALSAACALGACTPRTQSPTFPTEVADMDADRAEPIERYVAPAADSFVLFTNDINGELEPCGCRSNPLGGLVRHSKLLDEIRRANPASPLLMLDAGNLLFDSNELPATLAPQSVIQARNLLSALEEMGLVATTPGPKDFGAGIESFRTLTRGTKIPFLSANLRFASGPQLRSHFITRIKKHRVAIIGLSGGQPEDWPKGVTVSSPHAALKRVLAQIGKQSDHVIVLSQLGLEQDIKLAEAFPSLLMIIGGGTQSFLQSPATVGTTRIVQSSFRNQYVGVQAFDAGFKLKEHRLVALDEQFENAGSSMLERVRSNKTEIAELNRTDSRKHTSPGSPEATQFQTYPQCAACHSPQFKFWAGTQHAHALHTLLTQKQAENKDCLSCHSVGLGQPGGFDSVLEVGKLKDGTRLGVTALDQLQGSGDRILATEQTLKLERAYAPVQCENCHGAAGEHPFTQTVYTKTVNKERCLTCHTPARAPSWFEGGKPNWSLIDQKFLKVACPTGEGSPN